MLCTFCSAGSPASSPAPRRGCCRGCASPDGGHRSTSSRQASVPSQPRAKFSELKSDGVELSALERGDGNVSAAVMGDPLLLRTLSRAIGRPARRNPVVISSRADGVSPAVRNRSATPADDTCSRRLLSSRVKQPLRRRASWAVVVADRRNTQPSSVIERQNARWAAAVSAATCRDPGTAGRMHAKTGDDPQRHAPRQSPLEPTMRLNSKTVATHFLGFIRFLALFVWFLRTYSMYLVAARRRVGRGDVDNCSKASKASRLSV